MPHRRIEINYRPCIPQSVNMDLPCYHKENTDKSKTFTIQREYIGEPNFQFIYNIQRFLPKEYGESAIEAYSIVMQR